MTSAEQKKTTEVIQQGQSEVRRLIAKAAAADETPLTCKFIREQWAMPHDMCTYHPQGTHSDYDNEYEMKKPREDFKFDDTQEETMLNIQSKPEHILRTCCKRRERWFHAGNCDCVCCGCDPRGGLHDGDRCNDNCCCTDKGCKYLTLPIVFPVICIIPITICINECCCKPKR